MPYSVRRIDINHKTKYLGKGPDLADMIGLYSNPDFYLISIKNQFETKAEANRYMKWYKKKIKSKKQQLVVVEV